MVRFFGEERVRQLEDKAIRDFEGRNQAILRKYPDAVRRSTLRDDYLVREYYHPSRGWDFSWNAGQKFDEAVLPIFLAQPAFPKGYKEALDNSLETLEEVRAERAYLGESPAQARARRKRTASLPF
jgi:hypothetical protein